MNRTINCVVERSNQQLNKYKTTSASLIFLTVCLDSVQAGRFLTG